jgi:hypothetical protein
MESRLIDINSRAGRYHYELLKDLKAGNYNNLIGELKATNALLPEEFRIKISTTQYNEKIKTKLIVKCPSCESETNRELIRPYNKIQSTLDAILTKKNTIKVWKCPDCGVINPLSSKDMIQETLPQPSYFRIIPDPPKRENNLTDRQAFESNFKAWAWLFVHELEKSIADYREKYLQRNQMEGDLSSSVPEELII